MALFLIKMQFYAGKNAFFSFFYRYSEQQWPMFGKFVLLKWIKFQNR